MVLRGIMYRLKHALRAIVDILFLSPREKEQYIHNRRI